MHFDNFEKSDLSGSWFACSRLPTQGLVQRQDMSLRSKIRRHDIEHRNILIWSSFLQIKINLKCSTAVYHSLTTIKNYKSILTVRLPVKPPCRLKLVLTIVNREYDPITLGRSNSGTNNRQNFLWYGPYDMGHMIWAISKYLYDMFLIIWYKLYKYKFKPSYSMNQSLENRPQKDFTQGRRSILTKYQSHISISQHCLVSGSIFQNDLWNKRTFVKITWLKLWVSKSHLRNQGSPGRRRHRRRGFLKSSFLSLKWSQTFFLSATAWVVVGTQPLGYKSGISKRKQRIWNSRTVRTSTSYGDLIEIIKTVIERFFWINRIYL